MAQIVEELVTRFTLEAEYDSNKYVPVFKVRIANFLIWLASRVIGTTIRVWERVRTEVR